MSKLVVVPKRMVNLEQAYAYLCMAVDEVYDKFLLKYESMPLAGPNLFRLDVKAYCVLCHAAFEEYIERISLIVLNCVVDDYIYTRRVNDSTMMFIHSQINFQSLYNEDKDEIIQVFDYVRKKLELAKDIFSRSVNTNHGFGLKYMSKVLTPFAIDISKDANLMNSLVMLTGERGFHAHKTLERGNVKDTIGPEIAFDIVFDCLVLCEDILNKAKYKVKPH
ncbi:HEPN domain-containing protein [Hymenobacter psychrotolerans]|uniref:RiboL-PSP-HEPN domain-containing protein n=1 Tax=Hymenobacter psychrotolerans DSM 18569 TaxID=1121959 RepID=A0A1M6Z3B3_9BACT|nr:HEPN domain-containing protein [Hymenobacter psychrotolerans]SHL24978.1 hypothetical protein SAMN02746009_02409 [Hymenobacter psychrotolerans DSM 18569]